MNVALQPADQGDLDLLVSLVGAFHAEEALPFDEGGLRDLLTQLIATPHLGRALLITAAGDVVGYLVITFGFSLEYHGRDAFVDELYLLPPFRGQGVGTAALTLALEVAQQAGVQALHLEVERHNQTAQGLYRKLGFDDTNRLLLTRRLCAPSDSGAL